jgi:RNase P/RNase MRP subunit p29
MPGTSSSLRRACATLLGVALAAAAIGGVAAAKPDDEPKPKPKLELLTETQEAAISKGAIKLEVRSKRGDEVRVKATLVVEGFPADYTFRLRPESKRLRNRKAKVLLRLSPRQREVLAFSAQACDGATLDAEARAARRTGKLTATLPPESC